MADGREKAAFINQVATGRAVEREVEDIGDQALSFAEVKALATGNPLILEKAGLDAEVARLSRLRRSHLDDHHRLKRTLSSAEARVATLGRRIAELETAIARRVDTRGERFEMTVEGVGHRSRADAGQHLLRVMASRLATPGDERASGIGRLGRRSGPGTASAPRSPTTKRSKPRGAASTRSTNSSSRWTSRSMPSRRCPSA